MEVVSRLGMGVVTLEDHPTLGHVTGSPPLQLLQWLFELVGEQMNTPIPLLYYSGEQARQSSG